MTAPDGNAPSQRARPRWHGAGEPLRHHVTAGLVTLALLSLLARLLWQLPDSPSATGEQGRMQMRWIPRLPPPTDAVAVAPEPHRQPLSDSAPTSPQAVMPAIAARPSSDPVQSAAQPLYDEDGRIRLPDARAGSDGTRSSASRVFEHRDELETGVGKRATAELFSRRPAGTPQSRAQRLIYGDDIQAAEARRPPEVAFNPSLHERPSDLGSEATGDAYKAAPIRHEPLPGLDGEASRRIRAAIGELERRHPRCDAAQRRRWLAPVQQHLEALQRLEYRYNHGADPVEAEHSLPSAADSAYDLARRALWQAGRQMQACG